MIKKLYKGEVAFGKCFLIVTAALLFYWGAMTILDYTMILIKAPKLVADSSEIFISFIMGAAIIFAGISVFRCANNASNKITFYFGKTYGVLLVLYAVAIYIAWILFWVLAIYAKITSNSYS